MLVQAGLCWTCSETTLLVFPRGGSYVTLQEEVKKGSQEIPDLPLLQLSSANIDRFGAYLLDTGDTIYLYIGSAINEQFCRDILDKPNFASIKEGGMVGIALKLPTYFFVPLYTVHCHSSQKHAHAINRDFYTPPLKKVRGIMLYPPKKIAFECPSVRPSVRLSVRPSAVSFPGSILSIY